MTAKINELKSQLESNLTANVNAWKAELHSVNCEIEMLLIGGSVYELSNRKRNHYRALINYRQDVSDYIETLNADLAMVRRWTKDTFVWYLHNDNLTRQWVGWIN